MGEAGVAVKDSASPCLHICFYDPWEHSHPPADPSQDRVQHRRPGTGVSATYIHIGWVVNGVNPCGFRELWVSKATASNFEQLQDPGESK